MSPSRRTGQSRSFASSSDRPDTPAMMSRAEDAPLACCHREQRLRVTGQATETLGEKTCDILRDGRLLQSIHIPRPTSRHTVTPQIAAIIQRCQEEIHKVRVSPGARVDQPGELHAIRFVTTERLGEHHRQIMFFQCPEPAWYRHDAGVAGVPIQSFNNDRGPGIVRAHCTDEHQRASPGISAGDGPRGPAWKGRPIADRRGTGRRGVPVC